MGVAGVESPSFASVIYDGLHCECHDADEYWQARCALDQGRSGLGMVDSVAGVPASG